MVVGVLGLVPAVPGWSQTGEVAPSFWRKIPGPARYYHTATLLPTGRVLVAGGCEAPPPGAAGCAAATDRVEIFDPATATWSPAAKMTVPRTGHTATVLPGGDVLVVGGCSGIGPDGICDPGEANSAERYSAATGAWARVGGFEPLAYVGIFRGTTATLQPEAPAARCGSACGKVLLVGIVSALIWDPATATSTPTAERITRHGSLLLPAVNPSATQLPDGRLVVASADLTSVYDPASDSWSPGAKPSGRDQFSANPVSPSQVLVTGGVEADGSPSPFPDLYEADAGDDPAATGRWRPAARPAVTRLAHAATDLGDGEVLVTGGRDAKGNVVAAAEVYRASTDRWRPAGAMTRPRGGSLLANSTRLSRWASLTTTTLPDGRILAVGGDAEEAADLYSPVSGGVSPLAPSPSEPRSSGQGWSLWWALALVPAALVLAFVIRRRRES